MYDSLMYILLEFSHGSIVVVGCDYVGCGCGCCYRGCCSEVVVVVVVSCCVFAGGCFSGFPALLRVFWG